MSVSTLPSHIWRTSAVNGYPLSHPSGFAMRYPFHYLSISSLRTTKVHLSYSSEIRMPQYFLRRRQHSLKSVALGARASDRSGREAEDALLDEPYDVDGMEEHNDLDDAEEFDLEKQFRDVERMRRRDASESDEEEETEFPEDPEESYFKPRTSNRFSGDAELGGANESDEEEESEFPEDSEESYFKSRTSNRFSGDSELGDADECDEEEESELPEDDEEEESELPEDSEESYFNPRSSNGFHGDSELGDADESDEEEESEFPEDPEKSYLKPKTSNAIRGDSELGGVDESDEEGESEFPEDTDLEARGNTPWMYTGEGLGGVHDDAETSYLDSLEGYEEEVHRKHSVVDTEFGSFQGSELIGSPKNAESNDLFQNEQKDGIPDLVEGQEKMMVNEAGDVSSQNEYIQELAEPYPMLLEEAKLYVGNLPYDVDSKKLAEIFNAAGIVEIAEVVYSRETDQSRGFGFVTMRTVEDAEKAIEMFNRREVDGRFLVVNKALDRGSPSQRARRSVAGYKAYCGNVPYDVDDSRLQDVFSEYGKVLAATIIYDKVTGQSRGFGFVAMSTEAELEDAIAALDGQVLDGRRIRVARAEERIRNNFRPPTDENNPYSQGQIGFAPDGVA